MIKKTYDDFDHAWKQINELFLNKDQRVSDGRTGLRNFSFNNVITLEDFAMNMDIGKASGYSPKKWPHLLRGYLDVEQLKWLREKLYEKRKKGHSFITLGYTFRDNQKSNGSCLIGFTFIINDKTHEISISFYSRISEVTRRMLYDYAMFNRIIHYLFDDQIRGEYSIGVELHSHTLYQTALVAPILAPKYLLDFDKRGYSRDGSRQQGYLGIVEWSWNRYLKGITRKFAQVKRIQIVIAGDVAGKERKSIVVKDLRLIK